MSVLVTGGTGTLGHALTRYWLRSSGRGRLLLYSRDEEKQWRMNRTLQAEGYDTARLRFFIGDVRDRRRLGRAMEAGVETVIHAAAMKRVESCEYNPLEAVRTNIHGTENVIEAALDCEIPKVMLVSSDKAVHPVNLYGVTKAAAEKLMVRSNSYAGQRPCRFSCVRYGNVLGSRGSFFESLPNPIPITDERMTRFWWSIGDAVRFLLSAVEWMQGGEIFIPKHIEARSVLELAQLAKPRTGHRVVGIRPGEKLHETLICREESLRTVLFDAAYIVEPEDPSWPYRRNLRAQRVPEGFELTSENCPRLSDDQARRLLQEAA